MIFLGDGRIMLTCRAPEIIAKRLQVSQVGSFLEPDNQANSSLQSNSYSGVA